MASSYAPSFHLFPRLPYEIRLAIIEEFLRSLGRIKDDYRRPRALLLDYGTADRRLSSLAEYARIDRQWKSVVEKRTFRSLSLRVAETDGHSSLDDFERICVGDRTNLISEIYVQIELDNPIRHRTNSSTDTATLPSNEGDMTENGDGTNPSIKRAERVATAAFGHLFRILHSWSRDQEPLSFTYSLHCEGLRKNCRPTGTHLEIDSSSFPEVACIGSFTKDDFDYGIQPKSSFRLLTKFPNVQRADVTFGDDLQSLDIIEGIQDGQPTPSFQGSKLTSLYLEAYARWFSRPEPFLQIHPHLTQSIFAMGSRLEELYIHYVVDVPYFLSGARAANGDTPQDSPAWPNMRVLGLNGYASPGLTDNHAAASARLYDSVTKALPNLPSITRLQIEVCSPYYIGERRWWDKTIVHMDVPPRDDRSAVGDGMLLVDGPEPDPETQDAWQQIARRQWHCRLVPSTEKLTLGEWGLQRLLSTRPW